MTKNFTAINDLINNYQGLIGSSSKESEPLLTSSEINNQEEFVPPQEIEKKEPQITIHPESIELPPDLRRLGLKTPPSSVTAQYNNIKLPISDEKIVVGLKAPITSSLRWLSTLAIYILSQAHLGLKVVHGHVVRIIRR